MEASGLGRVCHQLGGFSWKRHRRTADLGVCSTELWYFGGWSGSIFFCKTMTLDISQIKWSGDNGTWVLHGTPLVMSNIFHQATQLRKTRVSYSATIQGFHIYHYLSVFVGSGCQQTHRTYDLTTSRHRRSSGLGVLRLSRSASPCEWVMGEDLDSRGCRCRWVGGCFWSGLLMRWMITDVFMIYIYIWYVWYSIYINSSIPLFCLR